MTQPFPISLLIENAVVNLISNTEVGLIATMRQLVDLDASYGSMPELDLAPGTTQLFRADGADQYFSVDNPEPIALFVHVDRTADKPSGGQYSKNKDFAGSIVATVDVVMTTAETEIPIDLQRLANLFNDAMYRVFGVINVRNLAPVLFNGGIAVTRSKPAKSGENWFQKLSFAFPMGLN